MDNSTKNADRFIGFAEIYENARPQMPRYVAEIIVKYFGTKPNLVVDLGCGTGLSTVIWEKICKKVIGIEPSMDMLEVAIQKANGDVSFQKGFSHETGLEENSVDVVTCSQSFHWMNPIDTLNEVNRILKTGGIFATIDCDWPPVCNWKAEKSYNILMNKVDEIEEKHTDCKNSYLRWDKNQHLTNINNSGIFRYCREILFSNKEECNAQRFVNIALSQGGLQSVLKTHPDLIVEDVENFKTNISGIFGSNPFDIEFGYRMRIGIK